jgi:hypothetical protein
MLINEKDVRLHSDAINSSQTILSYLNKYKGISEEFKELFIDSIKYHLYAIINSSRQISIEYKILFSTIDWKSMSSWESGDFFHMIPDENLLEIADEEDFIRNLIDSINAFDEVILQMTNTVYLTVDEFISYINNDGLFLSDIWISNTNTSKNNPLTIKQLKSDKLAHYISSKYKHDENFKYLMSDLLDTLVDFEFNSKKSKPKVVDKKKNKVNFNLEYNNFIESIVGVEKHNDSKDGKMKLSFRTNNSIWTVKKK